MKVYHEESRNGHGFMKVSDGVYVIIKETYSSHPLHPHFCFRNSCNAFRASSLQLSSFVSTRKATVSLESYSYQTSRARRREGLHT